MTPADLRQMIEAATPGPWKAGTAKNYITVNQSATNKRIFASVCTTDSIHRERGESDTKLTAALVNQAPAILALWEAAQDLDRRMKLGGDEDAEGIKALRAALAGMGK